MSVHLYFAPNVMKLGANELAPQTVWAVFDYRKIGDKGYWECVVVGTDDTKHLVDDATFRKASEGSMPFAFGIDVLCPNGVKDVPVEELEQFRVAAEVAETKPQAAPDSLPQAQVGNKELLALVEAADKGTSRERVVNLNALWKNNLIAFQNNEQAYGILTDKFRDATFDTIDEGTNWKSSLEIQMRHVGARLMQAVGEKREARRSSWIALYSALVDHCGITAVKRDTAATVLDRLLDDNTDWSPHSMTALVDYAVDYVEKNGSSLSAQAQALHYLATVQLPRERAALEYAMNSDAVVYAKVRYTSNFLTQGACDPRLNPMMEAWNLEKNPNESTSLEAWVENLLRGMSPQEQKSTVTALETIILSMCPSGTRIEVEASGNIKIPFTPQQLASYGAFARYLINVVRPRLNSNAQQEPEAEDTGNPTDSPFVMPYLMQCNTDDPLEKRLSLMNRLRNSYQAATEKMVNTSGREGTRKSRALAKFINLGMPGLQPINKDYWKGKDVNEFLKIFCVPYISTQWKHHRETGGDATVSSFAVNAFSQMLTALSHWRNDAETVGQWENGPEAALYKSLYSFYISTDLLVWVIRNIEVSDFKQARDAMLKETQDIVQPALARIANGNLSLSDSDTIDNALNALRVKAVKSKPELYDELRKWFDEGRHSSMLPVSLSSTLEYIWGRIRPAVVAAKADDRVDVLREQCFGWRDMLMQLRPLQRDTLQWASAKYSPDNIYEAMEELKRTAARSELAVSKVRSFVQSSASESASSVIWDVHSNEAKSIWSLGETVICYASLVENVKILRNKLSKLPDTSEPEEDFLAGRQDPLLVFDRGITVDGLRRNILHKWIVANKDNLTDAEELLNTFLDTLMELRPLKMSTLDWTSSLPTGLSLLYKFIVKLQMDSGALAREMNVALGVYADTGAPAEKPTKAPADNGELTINKDTDGKISYRKIRISGSETYSRDTPDVPASGIDIPELFDMSSPLAERLVNLLRSQSPIWFLDQSITEHLSKNTKYIGLKKRLPLDNFIVVGGNNGSSCTTVSLAGKRVGVLTLDPAQIARIAGGFTTTAILHVATHEIAHFIFMQLKNTEKMEWRKEIAGRKLHPRQGADGYGFETEQFAILAETMVWGNSFRGLYNTNGMSVVEKYFYNNFITEEDKKKRA